MRSHDNVVLGTGYIPGREDPGGWGWYSDLDLTGVCCWLCKTHKAYPLLGVILAKIRPIIRVFFQKGAQNRVVWLFFLEKFAKITHFFTIYCKIWTRGFPTQSHTHVVVKGFLAKKSVPSEQHISVYQTYVSTSPLGFITFSLMKNLALTLPLSFSFLYLWQCYMAQCDWLC